MKIDIINEKKMPYKDAKFLIVNNFFLVNAIILDVSVFAMDAFAYSLSKPYNIIAYNNIKETL